MTVLGRRRDAGNHFSFRPSEMTRTEHNLLVQIAKGRSYDLVRGEKASHRRDESKLIGAVVPGRHGGLVFGVRGYLYPG